MSGIDQIAGVQITAQTVFPKGPDFETILFLAQHTLAIDRVVRVGSPDGWLTLGGTVNDPTYKALQVAWSQPIKPASMLVGKRLSLSTQLVHLIPKVTTEGYKYEFTIEGPDGVEHAIEYTNGASETLTTVGDALAALIDPITDLTAVDTAGDILCTAVAGELFTFKDLPPIAELEFQDTSTDPGIDAEFATIRAWAKLHGLGFFGVAIDHNAEAIVKPLAAALDALNLCGVIESTDSGVAKSSVTNDVASDTKTAGNKHVFGEYVQYSNMSFRGLGLLVQCLTGKLPGTFSLAHKTVGGVQADRLEDAERQAIEDKNWNWYVPMLGVDDTFEGKVPNGSWFDFEIGEIWQASRIQLRVFTNLRKKDLTPYTDAQIKAAGTWVLGALGEGVKSGFLSAETPPTVTVQPLSSIPDDVKASRRLTNVITFEAKFSNAITGMVTKGTITL